MWFQLELKHSWHLMAHIRLDQSLAEDALNSPSPSTRVDHMLMFSIMWLADVWKRALMWSCATPVRPSNVRETSYVAPKHNSRPWNKYHGIATVIKDTGRRQQSATYDSKWDTSGIDGLQFYVISPAESLQSQKHGHLQQMSSCWVCRGTEPHRSRSAAHTGT